MNNKALLNYLGNNQWKEADQATDHLMRQSSTDLLILDELWTRFSDGRFGFSVQSRIWQEVGCLIATPPDYNYGLGWESGDSDVELEKVHRFAQRVGWMHDRGEWVGYESLAFSLDAPYGHLPLGDGRGVGSLVRRFSRIITAKNSSCYPWDCKVTTVNLLGKSWWFVRLLTSKNAEWQQPAKQVDEAANKVFALRFTILVAAYPGYYALREIAKQI